MVARSRAGRSRPPSQCLLPCVRFPLFGAGEEEDAAATAADSAGDALARAGTELRDVSSAGSDGRAAGGGGSVAKCERLRVGFSGPHMAMPNQPAAPTMSVMRAKNPSICHPEFLSGVTPVRRCGDGGLTSIQNGVVGGAALGSDPGASVLEGTCIGGADGFVEPCIRAGQEHPPCHRSDHEISIRCELEARETGSVRPRAGLPGSRAPRLRAEPECPARPPGSGGC